MTPNAFPRLALVAACTCYVVAIAAVWIYLGWAAGLAAATAGPLLAAVLTVEAAEKTTPADPRALGVADVNELADELDRRKRAGEVPVARRAGRLLAGTGDDS
ncbi:hypothetical protein Gocc_2896 [Gaiella occulta]|uniref:Uncharacterized protein n=1 Tax=Gaiella occulta TaxID=1002870 RepID=A0A7M2YT89_9ACTN|nr:hypothetical protein [Gaiella occulta]RDI73296.1 hypothetical protein Gocc_2896 [Gaiella occulta]